MGEEEGQVSKNRKHNKSNCVEYVGLKILMQLLQAKTNLLVKPSLKLKKPTVQMNRIDPSSCSSCFLESCHLCKNNLSIDKDMYVYRYAKHHLIVSEEFQTIFGFVWTKDLVEENERENLMNATVQI